jgi:hypothetical protein
VTKARTARVLPDPSIGGAAVSKRHQPPRSGAVTPTIPRARSRTRSAPRRSGPGSGRPAPGRASVPRPARRGTGCHQAVRPRSARPQPAQAAPRRGPPPHAATDTYAAKVDAMATPTRKAADNTTTAAPAYGKWPGTSPRRAVIRSWFGPPSRAELLRPGPSWRRPTDPARRGAHQAICQDRSVRKGSLYPFALRRRAG